MSARVVVIGGGIGGTVAALALARAGVETVVVERGERLGGLVAAFEVGGTPLECFYHHIFPPEREIQDLIAEFGLRSRLGWYPSTVGIFTDGRLWPFTTPLDLVRFGPLPVTDRLRTGLAALRLGRVDRWEPLDAVPARDWLAAQTGRRSAEVVWEPLLRAKFGPAADLVPAAWMWARFRQRAAARGRGGERLGYLRGGFRQLFDAMAGELGRLGAEVRTATRVGSIAVAEGGVQGVEVDHEMVEADSVVFTGPLPALASLVPPEAADPRWTAIGALGVLCAVIELRRQVTDVYWTNVCDPTLPFGGVIEHTNLVPASDYGRHLMYVSRYFTHDEPIAATDPAAETARWVERLDHHYPGFSAGDVLAVHPFRTDYAAPLVRLGHLTRLSPMTSHIRGLFVSTTAQIYPQDRGMNEAARMGKVAAQSALAHLQQREALA